MNENRKQRGTAFDGKFLMTAAVALFLCGGNVMANPDAVHESMIEQQTGSITGTVLDANGEPIIGANILVKGTTTGTLSDMNGRFQLDARAGSTLVISYIGYKTIEVKASRNMTVTLQEDAELLSEVVVVGFGTQKKVNLTGAVSSVDVDKTFGSKPITDVSKGLQGTVPGLSIVYNNNDLTSSPTMKIRGTGSINGDNTPLILVDGVEVPDLSFVNPDNIQNISVLKDAASSSIYGSRAAWGVVLITTKDGSGSKDKVQISYSNNLSWNESIGLPHYITDKAGILAQLEEGILAQKNTDGSRIEAFGMYYDEMGAGVTNWFDKYSGNLSNPVYKYGEDWEIKGGTPYYYRVSDPNKELFKTSFNQTHNLGITGTSGNTNYNISLGYTKTDGNLKAAKENNVKRYNVNMSMNSQIKKWLNVGAKVMYVEKDYTYPYGYEASNGVMGLLYYTMRFPTFFPFGISDGGPRDAAGNLTDARAATGEGLLFRHGNAYVANEAINTSKDRYLTLGANMKLTLAKGLTLYADYTRGTYDYQQRATRQPYYVANWSYPTRTAVTTSNFLSRTFVNKVTNTYNAYMDYLFDVNKDHNFAVKVGMNAEDLTYDNQSLSVNGVLNPELQTLNLTEKNKEATVSESMRDRATAGFFGRINYNYKDTYLLELNGRYDGSSSFRPGKQWAFFPSASLGYRISQEPFWNNLKDVVSNLKLRASYGSVGNQALSSWYPYIPTLSTANVSWVGTDGNLVTTVSTPAAVNSDMTWEKIRTLDLGFDASFLQGDLNLTFDWYSRTNNGMLVSGNEIIRYVGIASAPLENGGNMKTNGWELEINYNHSFNKDFSVYGTFTMADAKSKITKWNNTTGALNGYYEGKELGEIWGFTTDRYYTAADFNADGTPKDGISQKKLTTGSFVYGPGDIKYVDLNGDKEISSGKGTIDDHGDIKRIGNALPRYEWSLRLGANYSGFDFEVLFQGVGKRDMWTTSSLFVPHAAGAQMNIFEEQLDYWTESNQNAAYPRPYINAAFGSLSGLPGNSGCNNFAPQTKYLQNLAYTRVKNVTLGYTIPSALTKKVSIDKVRVYFSVQNLFTFDHINGIMDPECTGGWSSSTVNGIDMTYAGRAMPFNRSWSAGVQVSF